MASTQRSLARLSRKATFVVSRQIQVPMCRRVLLSNTLRSASSDPYSYFRRTLFTTVPRHAAFAQQLPSEPTVVLHTPSPEYIKEEELDVQLLPPEEVKLVITDRAAEVRSPFFLNARA
ncbi:hypothetical protein P691DRAFT_525694 [Macrolepiota fuliginosa MF-IS2]|uniref:Uncharacterized protein n=1 Tax=Macrolepiota fuliginosa MF-IS2 TaxID=1400762 RepID=A0A9P6CAA0_9AGAR|nr:hypothetical protein P691DRAFT_525694 [Macrolepiota fuliginosa MF-IS2]